MADWTSVPWIEIGAETLEVIGSTAWTSSNLRRFRKLSRMVLAWGAESSMPHSCIGTKTGAMLT